MIRSGRAFSPTSMYSRCAAGTPGQRPRAAAKERRERPVHGRPATSLDRLGAARAVLRTTTAGSSFVALGAEVERELERLEPWAAGRSPEERASGPTIRLALELLRRYGQLLALDYGDLSDDEHRAAVVAWLALEHRWCYAAAGTDRESFKRATGRFGAR